MFIKRIALSLSFLPLVVPTTADARPEVSHVITATVLGAIFGGGTVFFIYNYLNDHYMSDQGKPVINESE